MGFLIKDLSRMTNFSPARIRKWQERYQIFAPNQGSNGYWYYTNDDYRVLRNIQQRLARGQKLAEVMNLGRDALLTNPLTDEFQDEEWRIIQLIKDARFEDVGRHLDEYRKGRNYAEWIRQVVQPMVVLSGRAWESGFLTVAEEHSFSRWFHSYMLNTVESVQGDTLPDWMITVFPGDEHELGALMLYCKLRMRKMPVRFTGMLPLAELRRELVGQGYRRVSISVVMPQSTEKLRQLREDLTRAAPDVKICFGGWGMRSRNRLPKDANKKAK
ncbi:MAG: MerR family transcriptional regulator [Leptospiraceae bacterium]|nr:MerR family transcriptional regulator [Leptospiraceae bacterium]MCB1322496.1 MerR family transcriptional regulator [Leptospiraceae bacterium]